MEYRPFNTSNVTEYVRVPTSDHVAEIIGRLGYKIKALRNKTNTFIQTPMREGPPVFIVTGSQENVNKAKWEILSAADHFTSIRAKNDQLAQRRRVIESLGNEITITFDIPMRLVGLVVGTHGSTIRQIQQASSTLIRSPLLTGEPVFHVTGTPSNVNHAKELIKECIMQRTENQELVDILIPSQGGRLSKEFLQHRCLICGLVNITSHTIMLPCGHFVCINCSRALRLEAGYTLCPICSREIENIVHADI